MKKIKLLLAAIAAMVGLSASAQSWTAPTIQGDDPVAGQQYKVMNVGSGLFLDMGKAWFSWSTTAIVTSGGINFTMTADGGNWKFIRTGTQGVFTSGNGIAGDAMHVDNTANTYGITKLPNGYYHIHDAGGDASSLCWGYNSSFNATGVVAHADANADGWNCEWTFVSINGFNLYQARLSLYNEYLLAVSESINTDDAATVYNNGNATIDQLNAARQALRQKRAEPFITIASEENPQDLTKFYVINADFSTMDGTGWTRTGSWGNQQFGTGAMESWNNNNVSVTQDLTGLPNGKFRVSCDMISGNAGRTAYVYAKGMTEVNGEHVNAQSSAGNYNTMSDEVAGNTVSAYPVLVDNHNLTIGFKDPSGWVVVDNFKIYYYGPDLTALKEALQANIDAVADLEGTTTTAAYNAAKTYADGINMDELTTEEAIEATSAELNNRVDAAKALVAPYDAYQTIVAKANFAGVAEATINAQNDAVAAATEASAINAAATALQAAIDALAIDITSFTIKNPTAQSKTDWEGTDFGGQSDGVTEYWSVSPAGFYQTINLPAGKYRMTVVALQRTNMTGTVYANDNSTIIAQVGSNTVNNRGQAASWFAAGNGVNYVYFTLTDAADVTIGLKADETTSDHWTVWKSFALETFTETAAASYLKPGYDDAMAAAVAYQTVDMFDADKTALNNAITDNTVEEASATIAVYEAAIANLNAAAAAAAIAVANYTQYSAVVAAIGENTDVDLTSFVSNADFELNNLNGWTSVDGGNVANNGNFNSTYFVERWKNGVALGNGSLTHDAIVLPAGLYRITADAQNIEQYNNSVGGTGLFLCANEEKTEIGAKGNYSVYIKVADKTPLTIKFVQDDCTGNWISYDNVTLTYVAADYVYELVDGKMNATVAANQTAAKEAFEAAKTGANYQALMNAIAAAQASKDAYATAKTAIDAAKDLKAAHNFATEAATTTFADAIAAIETPYEANTLADADAANAGLTLGTLVTGWHAAADAAAVNFMENAFGLNDFDAALYINTWSNEGESDGSNFKVPFYEYFAGDGSSLPANTWTATLTGLENGQYEVSAWVRVRSMNGETAVADLTGITMDVNGGTAIDVTEGDVVPVQEGNARFQHKVYTAEGLVKDGTLNVNFNIAEENNIHWLSFKNIKYTKIRDLTPEEMATAPTAIALYNGEDEVTEPIALDKTNLTVTLNPVYTPADASEGYINWTSSDESVATVSSLGEVTAVLPGTATITATSTLDNTVSATAEVTVSFPESEVPASTYVNDGATRTVYTLGENLIKNGSFEYPNAYYGWTYGTGSTTAITSEKFAIETEGAANGDQYLRAKTNEGGAAAGSLNTSWPIEPGKTYVFGYKVKSNVASQGNQYIGTSLNTTKGQENSSTKLANPAYGTDWTDVVYTFESGDNTWLVFNARWLANNLSFDNFYLCEASYTLEGNVDYATAAIPTANIGTGAFLYSQDAIDAANDLVQGVATVEEVQAAYDALITINEPAEGQLFNVILTYGGWTYDQKAMTYLAGGRNDAGLYNIQYKEAANQNLAQAFTFTKVSGNNYKMSQIDADGNVRYICTGVPYSGNTSQIRTTTNVDDALVVTVIPTSTEGKWNLKNTAANQYIGSQDAGVYTVNSHIDFNIVETTKPSITINTTAAGWGTVMLPFAFAVADLPEKVTVWSVSELDGDKLTLNKVDDALEANKPYIIEGAWNETLTGDAQGTALNYKEGLLTGVYETQDAIEGTYILQKQGEKVGFYLVDYTNGWDPEAKKPELKANRAYLTVPAQAQGVKAFYLGDIETAIKSVFDGVANGDIYDISGRKVQKMQKGNAYIVNGKKVIVK